MAQADYVDYDLLNEDEKVERNRYIEALAAGLSLDAAQAFAVDTGIDVGRLRKLVAGGCSPERITEILF